MSDIFKKEIPKARINITLEIETQGAKCKRELPLKLLILGKFSRKDSRVPIGLRERMVVNRNNIHAVLNTLHPELNLLIPSIGRSKERSQKIHLSFSHFNDFHPETIAQKVPALNRLLVMRYFLKELKSTVSEEHDVRNALETLLNDTSFRKRLKKDIYPNMEKKELLHAR